jgi:hypothetical protein
MVPIYVLLVPETVDLEGVVSRCVGNRVFVAGIAALLAVAYLQAPQILFGEADLFEYPNYGLWGVSVVWNGLWWSAILAANLWLDGSKPIRSLRSVSMPVVSKLIIGALFIFAMTPYIGLRNYPALAMFSNLRTEGSRPNSFVPSYDLFGYQKDWVEIRNTNFKPVADMQIDLGKLFPEKLTQTLTDFGLSAEFYICPPKWNLENPEPSFRPFNVPFIELKRRVLSVDWQTQPTGIYVDYVRHRPDRSEARYVFKPDFAGLDEELLQPLTWYERMLISFRTFSAAYSPCRH